MLSIVYPNQSNFERFVIFSTLAHVERLPGYLVYKLKHFLGGISPILVMMSTLIPQF